MNNQKQDLNPTLFITFGILGFALLGIATWLVAYTAYYDNNNGHINGFQQVIFTGFYIPLIIVTFLSIFKGKRWKYLAAMRPALIYLLIVWVYAYINIFVIELPYSYGMRLHSYIGAMAYLPSSFMAYGIFCLCAVGLICTILVMNRNHWQSTRKKLLITAFLFIMIILADTLLLFPFKKYAMDYLSIMEGNFIVALLRNFAPNIQWIMLGNLFLVVTFLNAYESLGQCKFVFKQPKILLQKLSSKQLMGLLASFWVGVPILILGLIYFYVYLVYPYIFFQSSPSPSNIMTRIYWLIQDYWLVLLIFFSLNALIITFLWRITAYRVFVVLYSIWAINLLCFNVLQWVMYLNRSDKTTSWISLEFDVQWIIFIFFMIAYLLMIRVWRWIEINKASHPKDDMLTYSEI